MKTLTIRNVPDEVHAALRMRAAANGHSMEEEVRRLLSEKAPTVREERQRRSDAAIARIRAGLRAANGGRLPTGVVDEFLAEKHAAAEHEEDERRRLAGR